MRKSVLVAVCLFGVLPPALSGQATSTASRRADLQVGLGFVGASPDYDGGLLKGIAVYTTLDLRAHLGGEFVIHQANSSQGNSLYEQTYEIGPRYFRTYGAFVPYGKVMCGRGRFNFPLNVANLAYNIYTLGAGVDIKVREYLNVRVDYEFQDWRGFPPRGLTPQVYTFGVAYHVPSHLRRGDHY